MSGFTYSYRSKWTHPVFRNLVEAAVWAWLCDSAVWKDCRVNYNGEVVSLTRGQIITSRSYISKGFRLGEQSIRTLLARMERDGMINQHPTSRGTIITICNYDKYQSSQPATNQPLTSTQPAPNQNKKEGKEGKEGNKGIPPTPHQPDHLDMQVMFEDFWARYPNRKAKGEARKAYEKARTRESHENIIAGLGRFIEANPWRGELRYCKHPATWLNADGWADEYPSTSAAGTGTSTPEGATSYERGILASLARTSGG